LIFTGEDPSSATEVDVDPYKITCFYTDVDGDKTMIAFDSDLEQAVRQFKVKGGLKIFANVQSVQDLPEAPPTEGPTSCGSFAQTLTQPTAATSFSPGKAPKELQEMVAAVAAAAAAAAVIAVWEHVEPSTNATNAQASNSVPVCESRNTGDRFRTAPTSTAAHSAPLIYSAKNTAAHSGPFIYSANNTRGDRFQAAPILAGGDDETASIMPGLTPLKNHDTSCKQSEIFDETARTAPSTAAHSVPFIYGNNNTAAHSDPFIYSANNTRDRFHTATIIAHGDDDDETAASMPGLTSAKNHNTTFKQAEMSNETARTASSTATSAHYVPFIYSAYNTRGDRFCTAPIIASRSNATKEKDGDDETAASMPELTALKDYDSTCKQAEMFDETAREEEQVGNSEQQESDDESDDSLPPLVLRASPVKFSVPKEVDIMSKGDAEPSFASDAEGSGEIADVLGAEVAQVIDNMYLTSVEDIKNQIVAEAVKDKEGVDEDEDSLISEPGEDVEDDSSNDGWDVVVAVSDHSDDAARD
jgi:hypothetical protein